MEITANSPGRASGAPAVSFFILSRAFLAAPLPIPGVINNLGIDPSFLVLIPIGAHNLSTGRGTAILAIPNDASLRGLTIPAQSLTLLIATTSQLVLGNTAAITILP
jgi:hypothetical protein